MSGNGQGPSSFAACGVRADLVAQLAAGGIAEPFPIQSLTISDALAGRDVCGKAKTGSGKTLAFGLPLLQRLADAGPDGKQDAGPGRRRRGGSRPRGLVLVPTRELAKQVAEVLEGLAGTVSLRLLTCYGGTNMDAQLETLRAGTDIVVATPGRLIDLQQRGAVDLGGIRTLVIDEADRMVDMGFLPQLEWLLRHVPRERQTMLFSATLDGDVDRLVRHELTDPVRHEVASEQPTVSAMSHRFFLVHERDKVKVAAAISRGASRTIMFTRTKRGADRLVTQLREEGIDARAIHGDLRQTIRERTLSRFAGGRLPVLVATDVAARGLDIDDVEIVVHFDPPEDHKAYLHRSGRTARAGRRGVAATLVLWNEQLVVERIQKRLGLDGSVTEVFSNDQRLADLQSWESHESVA